MFASTSKDNSRFESAGSGGLDGMEKSLKAANHQTSLSTVVRQAVSKLETQRHRLGKKLAPPVEKLSCGLVGAGSFFNYAYLPALNRKIRRLSSRHLVAR